MIEFKKERFYGLVDCAQYPDTLAAWVRMYSSEVRFLFEGFPENEARDAGPVLFAIDDLDREWVARIDKADLHRPCFSVLRSAWPIDELQMHLQRFVFADLGEGLEGLLRFFDPRSLPSILAVLDTQSYAALVFPLTRWVYRGGREEWQGVQLDISSEISTVERKPFSLSQEQLDELEQLDEPHRLMSELCERGLIPSEPSYSERYQDFRRRYDRAVDFGLSSSSDRKLFCTMSYLYGEHFYQHVEIRSAIQSSIDRAVHLSSGLRPITKSVWNEASAISKASLETSLEERVEEEFEGKW